MPTATLTGPASDGVDFGHIEMGESLVDRAWEDPPFRSLGDYVRTAGLCQAARQGYMTAERSDVDRYEHWAMASSAYRRWEAEHVHPSVRRAVSSPDGMFEGADPDGGSVIPPHFVREVFDKARFRDTPFSRVRIITVPTNAGVFPSVGMAETSRADGSRWGGILGYWENEAQQLVNVHPKLANAQYRLKKLTVMVPATEELFDDASLLDGFVSETASKELMFQCNESMINGNGAGRPLGVVNNPATIQVPKDTGQAAATISASNVGNMWMRMHGPSRANSVFYANEEFDVDTLALPTAPLVGHAGEQPAPTLKGRYVHPLENCQNIGTPGDMILGDWSQYVLLMMGIRKTVSMHFKFDYMEAYFRFIVRMDGQLLWEQPLTSIHGTLTKAPFITIAQR
jgi:HK97 family phage major capsid protein